MTGSRAETIELTERQRERLDQLKAECKEASPDLPEPTDEQMMKSLLDTWDALNQGHYSEVVRVTRAIKRMGAVSPRGWRIAVEYIVEGRPGTQMDWLDEFLDAHCDGVVVARPGDQEVPQ